jgi:hypothetical protein
VSGDSCVQDRVQGSVTETMGQFGVVTRIIGAGRKRKFVVAFDNGDVRYDHLNTDTRTRRITQEAYNDAIIAAREEDSHTLFSFKNLPQYQHRTDCPKRHCKYCHRKVAYYCGTCTTFKPNGHIDEAVTVCFTDKTGLASRCHAIHISEFNVDNSFSSNQTNPRIDSDSESDCSLLLP